MSESDKTSIGDRFKEYEHAFSYYLPRRIPVIIRVDGKAFHSVLQHATKPFDMEVVEAMQETAISLCEQIQGAVLAYGQSDEISILIHNYKNLNTEAWFNNNIQKMVSVSASIATNTFRDVIYNTSKFSINLDRVLFDSRVFVLPEAEVCNYFIWRQQDAVRNSIQSLARSKYSQKQLHEKNCDELQEMIHQAGDNWNNLPTVLKRGWCIFRKDWSMMEPPDTTWSIDFNIPIFTQDREYINKHLKVNDE